MASTKTHGNYNAYLSKGIVLKYGATTASTELYIKDIPDMGTDPEQVEVTTLSDTQQTYVKGIKGSEALVFNMNYDGEVLATLDGLGDAVQKFELDMPDGGKYTFSGTLSARATGTGVNEAVGMSVSIIPSTALTFAKAST